MSSLSSNGNIRCWICKKNGENRFFSGYAARKVHEDTMHASKYSFDVGANRDAEYPSFSKGNASKSTNFGDSIGFGAKTSDSDYLSQSSATPTYKGQSIYNQMENLKKRFSFLDKWMKESAEDHHFAIDKKWLDDGGEAHQCETKSFNIRLKQAIDEKNAKMIALKQLKADFDLVKMELCESQKRESQLEDQLIHARDDVEYERNQLIKMKQAMEKSLNCQKIQMSNLKQELDNAKMMAQQNECDADALLQMEKKMKQALKELAIERKLKVEAKKSQEECQDEVDELLQENEEIRKRFRQCSHDLERLQDEHKFLIADYNAVMDKNDDRHLEEKIFEAQQVIEAKFNDEISQLACELERYQMLYDGAETKLQQRSAELQQALSDLSKAESYRQEDIDRLLKEKESLKIDLKAKKSNLKDVEAKCEDLASQVNANERMIKRLQSNFESKTNDFLGLEKELQGKNQEFNQLQKKLSEVEIAIKNSNVAGIEKKLQEKEQKVSQLLSKINDMEIVITNQNEKLLDVSNIETERKIAIEESKMLTEKLKQLEQQLSMKGDEIESVEMKHEEINQLLQQAQETLEREKENLQKIVCNITEEKLVLVDSLNEMDANNVTLQEKLLQAQTDVSLKSKEIDKLNRTVAEFLRSKIDVAELEEVKEQLEIQKGQMLKILEEKNDLEVSLKEEKQDLDEKLDRVLDANIDLEKSCIELETKICDKDKIIAELVSSANEEKEKGEKSRHEIEALLAKVSHLEEHLNEKRNELDHINQLKETVAKYEEEKLCTKAHLESLRTKMGQEQEEMKQKQEKFQEENRQLNKQAKEAKERGQILEEQIKGLKCHMETMEALVNEKQAELENVNKTLETAKSTIKELQGKLQETLKNCDELKEDLEMKKEECKQSQSKEYDLAKKTRDNEIVCIELEKKLAKAEAELEDLEAQKSNNKERMDVEMSERNMEIMRTELHCVKVEVSELQKAKQELETENEELINKLQNTEKSLNEEKERYEEQNDLLREIQELRVNLENMTSRENEIQKYNNEMKMKVDAAEFLQKTFEEESTNLKNELNKKDQAIVKSDSEIENLNKEIEGWQRKYNDLAESLAKAEANMQIMSDNVAKARKDFQKENNSLKKELESAKFEIKERMTEIELLQKQQENFGELSALPEERNDELNTKNRLIEEQDQEQSLLISEVRKLEGVIADHEEKIKRLEYEKEGCLQEKEIYEKQIEKQKNIAKVLKNTENDLEEAYDDIVILEKENEELRKKCKDLEEKINDGGSKIGEIGESSNDQLQYATSDNFECDYESDFEEDDEIPSESDDTECSDDSADEELVENKPMKIVEKHSDDEIDFEKGYDCLNFVPDDEARLNNNLKSIFKSKKSDSARNLRRVHFAPEPEIFEFTKEDELDFIDGFDEQFEIDEIVKVNRAENIMEDDLCLDDFIDDFEEEEEPIHIAPSEKKEEDFENDTKRKESMISDDEDDMLSNFLAKQKAKKANTSNATKFTARQKEMAAEMGLDDEVEIDSLLSELETCEEARKEIHCNVDEKKDEAAVVDFSSEKDEIDPESDSDVGIEPQQSGILFSSSLGTPDPSRRSMLLPPLRGRPGSLPPLKGVKKQQI